jgi:hypothetical protein
MCLSITLLTGCLRTRIVEKPVRVEIRIPVPVEVEKCKTALPVLPEKPARITGDVCSATFGAGAVCYDPANAVRLAALLSSLIGLYRERSACEPPGHGP